MSVIATVSAVIKNNRKILIEKRSNNSKPFNNKWVLPGGHLEKGETVLQGLKREIKEETNLKLENIKFIGFDEEIFPKEKWFAVTLIFSGKGKGKIKLNKESTEYKWITKKDLSKLKFGFNHKKIIKKFLK